MNEINFTNANNLFNDLIYVAENVKEKQGVLNVNSVFALSRLIEVVIKDNINCIVLTGNVQHYFGNISSIASYNMWVISEKLSFNAKTKLNLRNVGSCYIVYITKKTIESIYDKKIITEEQYKKFINDIADADNLIKEVDQYNSVLKITPTIVEEDYFENLTVSVEKTIPDFTGEKQISNVFNSMPNNGGVYLPLGESDVSFETGKKVKDDDVATTNILMMDIMLKRFDSFLGYETNIINHLRDHLEFNRTLYDYSGDSTMPMFYNFVKLVTIAIDHGVNNLIIMRNDLGKLFGLKKYDAGINDKDETILRYIMGRMRYHFGGHVCIDSIETINSKGEHVVDRYKIILSDDLLSSLNKNLIISDNQYDNFIDNSGAEETIVEPTYINDFMKGKLMTNTKTTKKNKFNDKDKALVTTWTNEAIDKHPVILELKNQLANIEAIYKLNNNTPQPSIPKRFR